MEQLVARWAHNPKAAGSSPAPATKLRKRGYCLFFFGRLKTKNPGGGAGTRVCCLDGRWEKDGIRTRGL
jgi:hypothetical protein